VLLGNGDGTFQTASISYVTGTSAGVAVGDFNGDGLPDLAVTSAGSGRVFVLANGGSSAARVNNRLPDHALDTAWDNHLVEADSVA
jgi:hypothetical protein